VSRLRLRCISDDEAHKAAWHVCIQRFAQAADGHYIEARKAVLEQFDGGAWQPVEIVECSSNEMVSK
jgi:hypothetical protein